MNLFSPVCSNTGVRNDKATMTSEAFIITFALNNITLFTVAGMTWSR